MEEVWEDGVCDHCERLERERDAYAREALVALAGHVCTPAKGYVASGGPGQMASNIRELRARAERIETAARAVADARAHGHPWAADAWDELEAALSATPGPSDAEHPQPQQRAGARGRQAHRGALPEGLRPMRAITHFYSDPHFNHISKSGGIIKLADRPFDDIEHMNETLISNYNEVVGEQDTVLWVGDAFFYRMKEAKEIMDRLNGHKLLVLGNHDKGAGAMSKLGFLVMKSCVLYIAGRVCEVCHYPYAGGGRRDDDRYATRRPTPVKGRILIHGHHHMNRKVYKNMVHVGVDAWDFYPAPMAEVEALIRRFFPV